MPVISSINSVQIHNAIPEIYVKFMGSRTIIAIYKKCSNKIVCQIFKITTHYVSAYLQTWKVRDKEVEYYGEQFHWDHQVYSKY